MEVLIHWLANRTIAKMSEKTFYNDVEALAGDIYQQIGLLHTTVCKHIHIHIQVFYISLERSTELIGTPKTNNPI